MRAPGSGASGSNTEKMKVRDGIVHWGVTSDALSQLQSEKSQDSMALMSHYLCAAG